MGRGGAGEWCQISVESHHTSQPLSSERAALCDLRGDRSMSYNPRHNGYDIGARFLDGPTLSVDEWHRFVVGGEIVFFRDRLAELLRIEASALRLLERAREIGAAMEFEG